MIRIRFLLIALLATLFLQTGRAQDSRASFVGKKAPDLVVEKWLTKQPSTKDKWLLLEFWASWSGSSRYSLAKLERLQRAFKKDLVVIAVSDETQEKVQRYAMKAHIAHALDSKRRTLRAYSVQRLPHAVLIDPTGTVRWEGYILHAKGELTPKTLAQLMGRK